MFDVAALLELPTTVLAVFAVGALVLSKHILSMLNAVWVYFVRPGKNLTSYGEWAVVTGASDGIGKAYATEFARAGLKVVLISRTQSRLDEAATEIADKVSGTTIKTIAVDMSAGAESGIYEQIEGELEGLDIGILVNNVGMSYSHAEYFDALDDERIANMVELNVSAMNWMTKMVLPGMKERKRGAIVNISSAAGTITDPLYAVYSGTKAYVDFFSRALNVEYGAEYGIHVQCQIPFFVTTKLAKIRKSSLFIPTPAGFAASSVRKIGYEASIVPYWPHALQAYIFSWLPTSFANSKLMADHKALRKRALKRMAEKAAKAN